MPLLDEEKDMQISEKAHRKTKKALQQLEKQLSAHTALPDLAARLIALQQKQVRSSCPALGILAALGHRMYDHMLQIGGNNIRCTCIQDAADCSLLLESALMSP